MISQATVLLASHSTSRLNAIEDLFSDHENVVCVRKLIRENGASPLSDIPNLPDVVILDLGENWQSDLSLFAHGQGNLDRIPMLVIGRPEEPDVMRRSMQAGARDYFTSPIDSNELIDSVLKIASESRLSSRVGKGDITVILNGKGGAGATTLATSLASVVTQGKKSNTSSCALIDLDFQFGNLPVYFDMPPNENLMQAIDSLDSLDSLALNNLAQKYREGLCVFSNQPNEVKNYSDIQGDDIHALVSSLSQVYDHIIIDMPRDLDAKTITALEMANQILVVTQQTVPHVRDTKLLLGLIRSVGISTQSVQLAMNRFEKSGDVRLRDVQEAFPEYGMHLIPNDYKRVSFSVNNGLPVPEKWPKCSYSKAVMGIANRLWPERVAKKSNRRPIGMFSHA